MSKKIGRNEPCPCGSGKKYKWCCGSSQKRTDEPSNWREFYSQHNLPLELEPDAVFLDKNNQQIKILPSAAEALKMRFEDGLVKNANQFDKQYATEFHQISSELYPLVQTTMGLFRDGFENLYPEGEYRELLLATGSIISHILMSIEASVDLLRRGYRYQIPILLRHVVEATATAICITVDENALKEVQEGRFKSSGAITSAKKVFPVFGELYGHLTNSFTHLNPAFLSWEPLKSTLDTEATIGCIGFIKSCIVLARLSIELAFYDHVNGIKLLKEVKSGIYAYDDGAANWLREFLDINEVD